MTDVWCHHRRLRVSLCDVRVAALVLSVSLPARAWARQIANETVHTPVHLSLDVSASYDRLGSSRKSWRDLTADVAASFAPRASLSVGAAFVNRFGQHDAQVAVGGSYPVSAQWTAGAELQRSQTHRVFARVTEQAWLHRRLPGGWGAQLSAQRRDFTSARVEAAAALMERYVGRYRLAYQASVTQLDGQTIPASHRATVGFNTGGGDAITLGVASGHEAEAIASGQIVRARVRGVNVWGLRPLSSRWLLTYSAGVQQQGPYYTRTSARLGLRRVGMRRATTASESADHVR